MTLKILTVENPKTLKGEAHGYLTAVLHLAPARVAGRGNVCPWSTLGCRKFCLNEAGRGGIFKAGETTNTIQEARKRKTRAFFDDRPSFIADLIRDIDRFVAYAARHGLRPAVRLNGTSDLAWERLAPEIFNRFPGVTFYDYTKSEARVLEYVAGLLPSNYSLTFSRSELTGDATVRSMLAAGVNVAVPFDAPGDDPRVAKHAFEAWGHSVINGDLSDLRFKDPRGVVVALKAKGPARKDDTGFVVRMK